MELKFIGKNFSASGFWVSYYKLKFSTLILLYFNRFANIPIDHIFASPYERTMDTASRLLAQRNKDASKPKLLIKVEPAFIEVFAYFELGEQRKNFWDQVVKQVKKHQTLTVSVI